MQPILDYETPRPGDRPQWEPAAAAFTMGAIGGSLLAWGSMALSLEASAVAGLECVALPATIVIVGVGGGSFAISLIARRRIWGRPGNAPGRVHSAITGAVYALIAVVGPCVLPIKIALCTCAVLLAVPPLAAVLLPPRSD